MAKLYFKFGAMGGGKTLDLIRVYYNYLEKGAKPYVYKPKVDTREEQNVIRSRTGDEIKCSLIGDDTSIRELFKDFNKDNCDVILIDECNFLKEHHINDLKDIVMEKDIPILCYGLITNFQSYLFEGSKRLVEIADKLDEIKSVCWCGRKATQNTRVIDGKIVKTGEEIFVGGNDAYVPLCYRHFKEEKISKDDK